MTAPRTLLRLLAILALLATALTSRDAAADDDATRLARSHFERGEKLYALAKFREARDEYQLAFDASPLPALLFNIGQCNRNLGDYDAAIFSYRKYLTLAPDATNRAQVEQLIADLQRKKDRDDARRLGLQPPPAAAPPPPTPAEPSDAPIYKRWWFWTGIAVVAAGGGAVAYAATRSSGPPSTDLGNIVFGK